MTGTPPVADGEAFPARARNALNDANLQSALRNLRAGFIGKRAAAVAALPEFEALREAAKEAKTHALDHLDHYLERFEHKVIENGGQVHWARDASEAVAIVTQLCRSAGAGRVLKGKSMLTEEIGLNARLLSEGFEVIETDLGEYIIQLRDETPSHIIAPASHLTRQDVAATFAARHQRAESCLPPESPEDLLAEARRVLREKFLAADVGITGANLLVAETGQIVLVTNEGNGDLSRLMTGTHIVLAGLEKVVATLEDASTILRLLARSATGQEFAAYTTFAAGPKRADDPSGPAAFHVVLVDNGRTRILGSRFRDILRCIRCGACLNHCPVYGAIGGHAYGSVYSGPMGAVMTPAIFGLHRARHLPNASSFCGRCAEVCPVKIPLPDLMRAWRAEENAERLNPPIGRLAIRLWAFCAQRPRLYAGLVAVVTRLLRAFGGRRGRFAKLPLASGWTVARDFPVPERAETFRAAFAKRQGGRS
ncbi:MAG: LutB/LldF family L-lactate oxidation iron-sulfur protein [Alphaproteobacteria bacterium]